MNANQVLQKQFAPFPVRGSLGGHHGIPVTVLRVAGLPFRLAHILFRCSPGHGTCTDANCAWCYGSAEQVEVPPQA